MVNFVLVKLPSRQEPLYIYSGRRESLDRESRESLSSYNYHRYVELHQILPELLYVSISAGTCLL